MKTYKHLWDKFISMENLELAAKKAVKSKKSKWSTKVFEKNKKQYLIKLQQMLIDGSFNTSPYRIRKIYEPKERLIYILPLYPDHI
ncbi:MAG: reverse transcriptase, partial [Alphaproteobacteria bacterium]|nr:reverse transcriptase [Alphaproteobacteria bacterium]